MNSKESDNFDTDETGLVVRIRGQPRLQQPKPIKTVDRNERRHARLQRLVKYHTDERNQCTIFFDPDVYKALCKEADATNRSINEIVRLRMRESYGLTPLYSGVSLSKDLGVHLSVKQRGHLGK